MEVGGHELHGCCGFCRRRRFDSLPLPHMHTFCPACQFVNQSGVNPAALLISSPSASVFIRTHLSGSPRLPFEVRPSSLSAVAQRPSRVTQKPPFFHVARLTYVRLLVLPRTWPRTFSSFTPTFCRPMVHCHAYVCCPEPSYSALTFDFIAHAFCAFCHC